MRETVQAFVKRTGAAYQPPRWLTDLYPPLASRDALPTLFRYPGPCGLRDYFQGTLGRLGAPDQATLWMADRLLWSDTRGAAHFGTVAILQPLRVSPCRAPRKGVYVGVNEQADPDLVAWVPPSFLKKNLPWDKLAGARDVSRELGPRAEAERHQVAQRLSAYLEELSEMERAKAPAPLVPWCELPRDQRLKLLADYGVQPRWSAQG
ncbi:hypothetical protein EDM80_15910 [bacterium]|nr:MAG: hypothetical protein EDM80_15910 [bacterium]RIK61498.1 MAG: hypothetical protein DCC64_13460 [Planctomycetota bacterium]